MVCSAAEWVRAGSFCMRHASKPPVPFVKHCSAIAPSPCCRNGALWIPMPTCQLQPRTRRSATGRGPGLKAEQAGLLSSLPAAASSRFRFQPLRRMGNWRPRSVTQSVRSLSNRAVNNNVLAKMLPGCLGCLGAADSVVARVAPRRSTPTPKTKPRPPD